MTADVIRDEAHEVNANPTKDLFISMLVRDITVRDAIGDLIDNSVDGALRIRKNDQYEGLHISLKIEQDKLTIEDNCGGIPLDVAKEYAFRFGRPREVIATANSVGIFGIGMKRALFKLGKWFSVQSTSEFSSFTIEVDVDQWLEEPSGKGSDWKFYFLTQDQREPNNPYPPESLGTKIIIKRLHDGIQSSLSGYELTNLINEIQREHLYNLAKGLTIEIGPKTLSTKSLPLLISDQIKPAYWEDVAGSVKVKIIAGISGEDKRGEDGGWYIFCNNRLVLGPDQTRITGWGLKKPERLPEYHSEFYRFRGYVFFNSEDPGKLPWNTTKTNLDTDSPIYKKILQQMMLMARSVIAFLYDLNDERKAGQDPNIPRTIEDATEAAQIDSVDRIMSSTPTGTLSSQMVRPPKVTKSTFTPETIYIRYAVTSDQFNRLKEYFSDNTPPIEKPGEIGKEIFDYFWRREIG